jgi:hypothetical protein
MNTRIFELQEIKDKLIREYHHNLSMSTTVSMHSAVDYTRIHIEKEIRMIDEQIYQLKQYDFRNNHREEFLSDKVRNSPEPYLKMMNISDIERFLRKGKLKNINKKTD